jgi:hypothetical protein
MLCLGMHSNEMQRLMVKAFQDPPLCSSAVTRLLLLQQSPQGDLQTLQKHVLEHDGLLLHTGRAVGQHVGQHLRQLPATLK